jgi:hypothetical protein
LRYGVKYECQISDIAKYFSPISECPTNFQHFIPISDSLTTAQSDIADHGCWNKCPPMTIDSTLIYICVARIRNTI